MERDWVVLTVKANKNQLIEQIIEIKEMAALLNRKASDLLSELEQGEYTQTESDK